MLVAVGPAYDVPRIPRRGSLYLRDTGRVPWNAVVGGVAASMELGAGTVALLQHPRMAVVATADGLSNPMGLAFVGTAGLLVCDTDNNCLQEFDLRLARRPPTSPYPAQ